METGRNNPVSSSPAPSQPTDGLDMWDSEGPTHAPTRLFAVRLDASEAPLIPFTTTMQRVFLHYLEVAAVRGYVHCLGRDCVLCRVGKEPETRDLLPLYDPVSQAVGVLAVSPNLRPQALRPQLAPVLRRLKGGERLLLLVRKLDPTRFSVGALPLPEDAEDGAEQIAAFCAQLEAGALTLDAVYPRLPAEELAAIPEVARLLKLKGVKPS